MAVADPRYDLAGALAQLMPGLVVQRELLDAAAARYAAKGFLPLGSTDVPLILAAVNTTDVVVLATPAASIDSKATTRAVYPAALPAFPTKLRRLANSNPDPIDGYATDVP